MQNLAEVWLWNKLVGALAWEPETATATFEYTPEWAQTGVQIAPLHMRTQPSTQFRGAQIFRFPQLNYDTFKDLPACFADTLPDDFGNAVINAWLSRNGRDPSSFNPLERLLYTAKRGMGALEYAPALRQTQNSGGTLELESLIHIAQQVLDQRKQSYDQIQATDDLSGILQVGTSAGGARAKALIAINSTRSRWLRTPAIATRARSSRARPIF